MRDACFATGAIQTSDGLGPSDKAGSIVSADVAARDEIAGGVVSAPITLDEGVRCDGASSGDGARTYDASQRMLPE
ncbi:hypothetical protein EMIT0111MI5_100141 [Burkholderia sp. IT-111MI5]